MSRLPTVTRAARRRAYFLGRIVAADTPDRRVAASVNYLRAVLASAPPDQAIRVADSVTAQLVRVADAVLTGEARDPQ
jgi:hypothetical protein